MRIDVHQHLWSEPLVEQLASRRELPFVRMERGLTVLYIAGERPYVIDRASERPEQRAELVEQDGLDRALLCLSSPIGIERLCREQATPLLEAYLDGALSADAPFGVWGAIALDRPSPEDVDRALDRGCVGISLPAGALAGLGELLRLRPILDRLEARGAPLFVHPGPGLQSTAAPADGGSFEEPLWWPALTHYVAGLQAAWMAFQAAGRADHPRLRVIFSMLAGLAPLHGERLSARGGPARLAPDPLMFYETSSYGPNAVRALESTVGPGQMLYGSDRPVIEPSRERGAAALDWELISEVTERALGETAGAAAR
jgi:predicted TIM-barrel fold metal-dependent hydrolase